MRFPIKIARGWGPLFSMFGMSARSSYVDVRDTEVEFNFGTANEVVPVDQISEVVDRKWPLLYGLGAKLGPDHGVSYVGSRQGVVQVRFTEPRRMDVWGPVRMSDAQCVTLSLEDAEGFRQAVERAQASG